MYAIDGLKIARGRQLNALSAIVNVSAPAPLSSSNLLSVVWKAVSKVLLILMSLSLPVFVRATDLMFIFGERVPYTIC